MSFLTGRPGTILLAALTAGLTVVLAGRPWITGTVDDAMIGGNLQAVTGDEAVTGIVALGLVVLAGAVAAAATRTLGRRVAAGFILLTALGLAALALRVVLDPAGVLGAAAAATTGRTGTLTATASATGWAYAALLPAVLALVVAVLAWRGARHWPQPSSAYDRPGGDKPGSEPAGRRGERTASDWEQLSEGRDPTAESN